MCGIIGLNWVDKTKIQKLSKAMSYRGPDYQGVYVDSNISLGHARLSIVDLNPRSNQPYISKQTVIVFNGEIYNHKILRKELEQKGHSFKTTSDTEVVLKGYEEYGAQVVNHLDGMFAFCIYDKKGKKLFLARDHFGIKPLYYIHKKNKFSFSSELKHLIEFTDKKISKQGLQQFFNYRFTLNTNTILKDIKKVLPGQYILYDLQTHKLSKKKYYQLPLLKNTLSRKENKKKIKSLLQKAVAKRMDSDVPTGSFLSGGLDSSIITTQAKKINLQLNTFSAGFETTNELSHAKYLANHLKTNHKEFFITTKDLYNNIDNVIFHMDEPIGDAGFLPIYVLSQHASKHNKIVLSGDGSDEIFCGYDRYKLYKYSSYVNWIPFHFNNDILKKTLLTKGKKGEEKIFEVIRLFDEKELDSLGIHTVKTTSKPWNLNEVMHKDIQQLLPNDFFMKSDKMGMAHGLEIRVPFMDKELVEFVMSIPPEQKLRGWSEKHILKSTFKKDLPKRIFSRKKHGFNVPMDYWFKHKLNATLKTLLDESKHDLYDNTYIYQLLKKIKNINPKHYTQNFIIAQKLWSIFVFESWYKKFIDTK